MKKIYFVRHAECESDIQHILAGQYNYVLTPRGHQQAAKFATSIPKDMRALTSPLARATETASPYRDSARGQLLEHNMDLRERSWGLFDGKTRSSFTDAEKVLMKRLRDPLDDLQGSITSRALEVEERSAVFNRMFAILKSLTTGQVENTVCFSHGHAIATLVEGMTGLAVPLIGPCGYVIFTFSDYGECYGYEVFTNRGSSSGKVA